MKKYSAFTLITALVLCVSQISDAEVSKNAKEANKLAREGAEASKNQEWDKAVELLRKATELERKYADELAAVYQQRGYAAASEQRFQDAVNDYDEALKLTPQDARIYEQRAAVEMKTNDNDKALADYSEAIKLKPNESRYYLYRGYIYETKGDIKSSMADTKQVLKLDPGNAEAKSRKERLEKRQSIGTPIPLAPIAAPSPKASPKAAKKP